MIESLLQNEFFAGIAGGSVLASGLYLLREVPERAWDLIRWRFTTLITVHNDDNAFEKVTEWLSQLPSMKKSRRTNLSTRHSGDDEHQLLTPGVGTHFARDGGDLLFIEREEPEEQKGFFRRETIHIRILGGPHRAKALVERMMNVQLDAEKLHIFMYRGHWRKVFSNRKRPLDTVVLPPGEKDQVLDDLRWFKQESTKRLYEHRGIPYRRGHLWWGPSGTGKTSLAMAVAGELGCPLYALNLGSIQSDDELFDAVVSVPSEAMLLIEDIDATGASATREIGPEEEETKKSKKKEGITLSGLLNVIDGAFSRDGRILVMTSNHPEKVDEALFRAGRVDVRQNIGLLEKAEALQMCRNILANDVAAQDFVSGLEFPVKPAELQSRLMKKIAMNSNE